jgi:prepilin-type N-terminal cleavage/methylation domain-containing protein
VSGAWISPRAGQCSKGEKPLQGSPGAIHGIPHGTGLSWVMGLYILKLMSPAQLKSYESRPGVRLDRYSNRGKPRGFTMVEVAIAVTILALALVPMLGVFLATSEETRANKNRTVAAALAASLLERYRSLPPEALTRMGFANWDTVKSQVDQYKTTAGEAAPSVPANIDTDLIVSPWSRGSGVGSGTTAGAQPGNIYEKEFAEFIGKLKFRRFVAFDQQREIDTSGRHAGVLTCAVVWFERTGGATRALDYKLSAFAVDPIFPFGSGKEL